MSKIFTFFGGFSPLCVTSPFVARTLSFFGFFGFLGGFSFVAAASVSRVGASSWLALVLGFTADESLWVVGGELPANADSSCLRRSSADIEAPAVVYGADGLYLCSCSCFSPETLGAMCDWARF